MTLADADAPALGSCASQICGVNPSSVMLSRACGRSRTARASALVATLALLSAGCVGFKRCAYEGIGRDRWQQPERVIAALSLEHGNQVADIGSGTGYFTFRLADAAGPDGRVYAVDIDEQLVEHLTERARDEGYPNVETVLAAPDDPRLEPGSIDLVFTCNTFHHIEDRIAYFARVRTLLRPGGRVAIVEGRPGWFHWLFPHATAPDEIRRDMEAAGYRRLDSHDWLSQQSFQVFTANE